MQEKPLPRSPDRFATFIVLDLAIEAIEVLRPIVATIRRCDRDLGEQLRRALSSVALNVAEGNRSDGGHRLTRFSTAGGSNAEARAALRVAVAWDTYVQSTSRPAKPYSIAWRACFTGSGRAGERHQ